jgi:hypothetical protein
MPGAPVGSGPGRRTDRASPGRADAGIDGGHRRGAVAAGSFRADLFYVDRETCLAL